MNVTEITLTLSNSAKVRVRAQDDGGPVAHLLGLDNHAAFVTREELRKIRDNIDRILEAK